MKAKEKKQLFDNYLDALNRGDVEAIVGYYDENGSCEDPVGSRASVGKESIRTFYQKALARGVRTEASGDVYCAGSSVAAPYRVMVGDMSVSVVTVIDFNGNGKIASMKVYWGPENVSKN